MPNSMRVGKNSPNTQLLKTLSGHCIGRLRINRSRELAPGLALHRHDISDTSAAASSSSWEYISSPRNITAVQTASSLCLLMFVNNEALNREKEQCA